ncbi:MAG TPA: hemerythrin domain-containing protein, partial [Gammaproteobacteria bacterium]|nr:hemerythrin domain-containing protein [Gammaproteobacteria bacterium]
DENRRFSKFVARDSVELEDGEARSKGASKESRASSSKSGSKEAKAAAKEAKHDGSKSAKHAAPKARSVRASADGSNALELLKHQHDEVKKLFEKLESAHSSADKEKIFAKLADALAAHTKIEETIFYPSVFDDETEIELREAFEEHLAAKRLVADLLEMEPTDPQFMSKASVLREVVQHHIEEEETQLFPEVRGQDRDDLGVLGRKLEERYKELIKHEPRSEVPEETRDPSVPF